MPRYGNFILSDAEAKRRLANTDACTKCGGRRYFSSRLADDDLCMSCRRAFEALEQDKQP